jgi:RNA polymerase sigma factor (sigma-70 family)
MADQVETDNRLCARLETVGTGTSAVNCVSDSAMARSKENDQRMPKRRRYVLPGPSEELDLARRAKNGDAIARDRLLSAHWPLVHQTAKKHATEAHPLFDLIQEGFVGLTRSFDKFDPEAGNRFSTFALRPVEWAILDYKRREQKKDVIPLDGAMVEILENVADLGNYHDANVRTSTRPAMDRLAVITHISPYQGGLAPETRDFIEELNAEAAEDGIDVKYVGLANRIEAKGDIESATAADNLGGWHLREARKVGYFEGEHRVLKAGNAQWRKRLRKLAKRKQA